MTLFPTLWSHFSLPNIAARRLKDAEDDIFRSQLAIAAHEAFIEGQKRQIAILKPIAAGKPPSAGGRPSVERPGRRGVL